MFTKKIILLTSCMAFIAASVSAAPMTNFDTYSGSLDLGAWNTQARVNSVDYPGSYHFNGGLTIGVGGPWGLQYRYHDMNTKTKTYSDFLGAHSSHYSGTTNEFNLLYSLGKDSRIALFAGVNKVSNKFIASGLGDSTLTSDQSLFQGGVIATVPLGERLDGYLVGGLGSHGLRQAEVGLSTKLSEDWQANLGYRWFQVNNAFNQLNDSKVQVKGVTFGVTYLFGKKGTPVVAPVEQPIVVETPAVVETPVAVAPVQKIIIEDVLFDFDKDTLKQQAYPILDNVVAVAKQNPSWTYTLVGNTDSKGSKAYNMDLSARRVKTVQYYLINQGIPANHFNTVDNGESKPTATNATPAGRAENRNVEIHIN